VGAELLRKVVDALDEAEIAHMVTGSFASALHGEPRATRDIDIVIDPDLDSIDILVTAFTPERFYVGNAIAAVRDRDMFNIIDTRTGWKVDLIVRKARGFSEAEFARRIRATIAGVATFVTTPEDAILSKLEWYSITPSDTQRRDVLEMLIVNFEELDHPYMQRWAVELGVVEMLDTLQTEATAERKR